MTRTGAKRPHLLPPLTCAVSVTDGAFGGCSTSEASLPPSVGMRRRRDGRKRSERRRSSLFKPASVGVCVTEEVEPQISDVAGDPELHLDLGVTEHVSVVPDVAERDATIENTMTLGQRSLQTDSDDVSKAALSLELSELAAVRHSTPEQPQRCVSRQTKRKAAQSATKRERGRRVERAPLKKPWEVKRKETHVYFSAESFINMNKFYSCYRSHVLVLRVARRRAVRFPATG